MCSHYVEFESNIRWFLQSVYNICNYDYYFIRLEFSVNNVLGKIKKKQYGISHVRSLRTTATMWNGNSIVNARYKNAWKLFIGTNTHPHTHPLTNNMKMWFCIVVFQHRNYYYYYYDMVYLVCSFIVRECNNNAMNNGFDGFVKGKKNKWSYIRTTYYFLVYRNK